MLVKYTYFKSLSFKCKTVSKNKACGFYLSVNSWAYSLYNVYNYNRAFLHSILEEKKHLDVTEYNVVVQLESDFTWLWKLKS